ncbi:hypothetical protein [Streptomyces sp. TLI_146]|uniref:hypothetical protein n=1 Tax=Streptomyces sp. TLI_146 TaxID=1938858 RepID=UPI000CBC8373|nr:hypothetical protein [Streptomyces sp. TLI_146]PKV83443.1 hypothetical protein BX283_0946 [Streptomyces sp. TLI_146]
MTTVEPIEEPGSRFPADTDPEPAAAVSLERWLALVAVATGTYSAGSARSAD